MNHKGFMNRPDETTSRTCLRHTLLLIGRDSGQSIIMSVTLAKPKP